MTGFDGTLADTSTPQAFQVGRVLIQTGAVDIALSAAASASAAVTFPAAFSGTPAVYLTVRNRPADYLATLTAVASTTAFGAQVRHSLNTAQTLTVSVQWIAIGAA